MRDSRLDKMAQVITDYSLEVKEGDLVLMNAELPSLPLVEATYEALIKAGAHVKINFLSSNLEEIFYNYAKDHQLDYTSPYALNEVSLCTKRIRIIAPENTRSLSKIAPEKQNRVSKAYEPVFTKMFERTKEGVLKWLLTLFPTQSGAQEAEMGLLDYEDFVYKALFLDKDDPVAYLKDLEKRQQKMVDFMTGKKELHFKTSYGTDLRVNVSGMKWINCCGKRNYPDGEIFTGPNLKAADGGINGIVRYTFPTIWQNTLFENIELIFEKGRVVSARASKNEKALNAIIKQDEGASTLGEIAIGSNYGIQTYTKNILFDEKIGGTFHAALGMGYPETGNTNKSALHWDMIGDLREGGTIEVDGEVISKDGKFVFPEWPR